MKVVCLETMIGGLGPKSCQQNQVRKRRVAAASQRRVLGRWRGVGGELSGIELFTLKPSLLTAAPFPLCSPLRGTLTRSITRGLSQGERRRVEERVIER